MGWTTTIILFSALGYLFIGAVLATFNSVLTDDDFDLSIFIKWPAIVYRIIRAKRS